MKPCKKLEIVIEKPLVNRLCDRLTAIGAPGYTVLDYARGSGDRGERRGDEPTSTSSNSVVIVACEDEALLNELIEAIRPLLSRSGGVCLVSDAYWVRH